MITAIDLVLFVTALLFILFQKQFIKSGTPGRRHLSITVGAILVPALIAGLTIWVSTFALRWYSWGVFVAVPLFIGFTSTLLYRLNGPTSFWKCAGVAVGSAAALLLIMLIFGLEGLICILMALPLELPLIILGALVGYLLVHRSPQRSVALPLLLFTVLPVAVLAEGTQGHSAPVYEVADAMTIAAFPETVWQKIISLREVPPPDDWFLKTGIACPMRVELKGEGVGARRVCTLTTGELHEQIQVWEPARRLRWIGLSTPPPMKEINLFRETDPPHLHGFYKSLYGEFALQPIENGTIVTRRTWYQHNLYPAAYWRVWCDFAARRGHVYVLEHLKRLSENHRTEESAAQLR